MKRALKFTLISVLGLALVLAVPVAYGLVVTPSRDAIYPVPGVTCACGFREYLLFEGDRGLWWNAGHNTKEDQYYTRAGSAADSLVLYDWESKRVGTVDFRWLWIDVKMDGYPPMRIFRQMNWLQLYREKWSGAGEDFKRVTFEDMKQKMLDRREKKAGVSPEREK